LAASFPIFESYLRALRSLIFLASELPAPPEPETPKVSEIDDTEMNGDAGHPSVL
jgi:hypothetical protein